MLLCILEVVIRAMSEHRAKIPAQSAAGPNDVHLDGRGRRQQHLQLRLHRLLRAVLGLRQPERHRQALQQRRQGGKCEREGGHQTSAEI